MSNYRVKAIKRRQRAKELEKFSFVVLRVAASARGLFRVGMSHADLVKVLS